MIVAVLRREFPHGRVDLVLNDILQIQIDRQVNLVAHCAASAPARDKGPIPDRPGCAR